MLGMSCQGSDVSMDCDWNGVRYEFMVPSNWKQDMNLRMQACNEGYINTGYNMVSDGSSWYATTDFEEDNTKLVNALNEIGFESQVVSYCQ